MDMWDGDFPVPDSCSHDGEPKQPLCPKCTEMVKRGQKTRKLIPLLQQHLSALEEVDRLEKLIKEAT